MITTEAQFIKFIGLCVRAGEAADNSGVSVSSVLSPEIKVFAEHKIAEFEAQVGQKMEGLQIFDLNELGIPAITIGYRVPDTGGSLTGEDKAKASSTVGSLVASMVKADFSMGVGVNKAKIGYDAEEITMMRDFFSGWGVQIVEIGNILAFTLGEPTALGDAARAAATAE